MSTTPKTSVTRDALCPQCGYAFKHATSANVDDLQAVPKEGAISLCGDCGAINIFTADRSVRAATEAEIAEIMADENVRRVVQQWQAYRRKQGRLKKEVTPQ